MIFFHGLGGDYSATWRYGKDDSTSWPHWLAEEFSEVGVWSLDYAASPSKWGRLAGFFSGDRDAGYSMSLPDRAGQVLDLMAQNGFGEHPILFICHSLGGLLAKQVLRKADDAVDPRKKHVAEQTRAVLFLATPHAGATLASLADSFPTVLGSTVSMKDLRVDDSHLRDLDDWYRNRTASLGIQTATYFEQRGVKGVLPIVGPTSARPGIGADPVGLDEDHLSIAKPRERDAQVCGATRELLRNYVLARRPVLHVQTRSSDTASETSRVLRELPPAAEKHFGRQTELKHLTERLRAGKNSAVVGPAGMGKTALAAEAVRAVIGETEATLGASPFPDGVVFLDLYAHQGKAEPAWNYLANTLAGPGFMETSPAHDRAVEACRARSLLIIIEGGEEADGKERRTTIPELSRVFSPQNRCLLLTRLTTQAVPAETVLLKETLHPDDAAGLLDSLTDGRLTGAVREHVLALLDGHPLALTWAGGLLARDDDDPEQLVKEWEARGPGSLSDPTQAEHTLAWLFNRSVRGLDETERQLLQAAGLLARAPFPLAAMEAVLDSGIESAREALKSLVQRGLLRRSEELGHWEFTHVLGYRFARKETGSDATLREHLGNWLSWHLHAVINDIAVQHEIALPRALEHAAALLRTDDTQKLWIPLANELLYDICDRLTDLGRLDLIGLSLSGAGDWLARLPGLTAQEPEWLRERSVLLNRRGDMRRDQGNLDRALMDYHESLELGRRLAEADPSNADRHDLSMSHEGIGDVLRDQGSLDGALTAYRESLALRRLLAQNDPSNAVWQHDLSMGQERIGDVLHDQGDLDEALMAYRESLALSRRLAQTDPSNAVWQRDLSVGHNKVGDVLRDQGDHDGALSAYRESLALRRLAETDPSNAVWQRDLSVSHGRIGDVLRVQGDLDGALSAYRESLALSRRLAQTDPSNAVWQRDLSVFHDKVGDVLRDLGNLDAALTAHRESLALRLPLAEADPSNALSQRDLSFTLTRLAKLYERQGDLPRALPLAEEGLEIAERLAALDPTNAIWQKDVAVSRALVARLRGDEPVPLKRQRSV